MINRNLSEIEKMYLLKYGIQGEFTRHWQIHTMNMKKIKPYLFWLFVYAPYKKCCYHITDSNAINKLKRCTLILLQLKCVHYYHHHFSHYYQFDKSWQS